MRCFCYDDVYFETEPNNEFVLCGKPVAARQSIKEYFDETVKILDILGIIIVRSLIGNFVNFKRAPIIMQPNGMSCKFSLTRDRSKVSSEYEFNFVGNSQLAIVPILQLDKTGYRLVGTASYFIRPNIFITAGHIFKDGDLDAEKPFYILSNSFLDYPLEIIKIKKYEALDIAFLTIEKEGEQYFKEVNPLAVMNLPPEKHEIVAVFGFSHSILDPANIIENNGETFQKMQIRSKWEVGGVLDIHESGKGMVKGQCIETSILAEGGDSGAPIFNSNGFLVGLLSTSFDFSSGLPNSTCVAILELAETEFEGTTINNLWVKAPRAAVCSKKCIIS